MAYAVLVSLTKTIEKILHDHDRYSISLHGKQHIISIHEYLIFLQAFLEDFPEKANSLEGQIRDVAYEAEDLIEDFVSEQIRRHHISKTQRIMSMFLKTKKRHHFEKVSEEIDSIARDVMEIKNSATPTDHFSIATPSSSSRLITAPTKKDIAMVGFEDNLLAIKERLCGESSKLQFIPIYGMGGIGKTTLARNAYDDRLTVERFHIRAWITISQNYSARHILSSLLVSVGAERSEEMDESNMAENIYKSLKGRRYLVVIDDMWDTKVWDDMKRIFPDDNNSSRIVLTTRLLNVAAYPDSSSPLHEMHFMDSDQSWNLLRQNVFKQEHCPLELENIGKEIAKRCRGLPLAIVVIAGLLSTDEAGKTQAYWEKIAKNVNEAVNENDEQFADIVLSLSYNHLPQHLKPCFLYMGGFPEDYEIPLSKLIKLYVAEGFLKLPNGSKSCEEAAEEYLEDLVRRSLVLVNKRKSNGKIKSCSFHDLLRNLCIRKAQEEKFFLNLMNRDDHEILQESIKDPRRLSIQRDFNSHVSLGEICCSTSVRTVLCFDWYQNSLDISKCFRLLRVLDVVLIDFKKIDFKKFPVEVLQLFHLRYLALRYISKFNFRVPASIMKLENLQTFVICPYYNRFPFEGYGVSFPSEIWGMSQLRHMVVSNLVFNLEPLSLNHALENLQTIAQVWDFQCTERMVQMLPNLKKLGILYNQGRIEWEVYQLHNLVHMHQLEDLKISGDDGVYACFWKNLAFPRMLKKLNLSGFKVKWQDMAIVGSLSNLEVLKLRYCPFERGEWETSEGEFRQLKFLQISHTSVEHWITESSHFPSLKHLQLYHCDLHEIPDGIGEIPTLELIEVSDFLGYIIQSAKRIQKEQQSLGNDALQVRVMHTYEESED